MTQPYGISRATVRELTEICRILSHAGSPEVIDELADWLIPESSRLRLDWPQMSAANLISHMNTSHRAADGVYT